MKLISARKVVAGAMLLAMFCCGTFLFALMSAKTTDLYLVTVVGVAGSATGSACFISEVYTVSKEQKRRTKSQSQSQSQEQEYPAAKVDEVSECSWLFVWLCFMAAMTIPLMAIAYAITLREEIMSTVNLIFPIGVIAMFMSVFLRPKDGEAGLKVLTFQYFSVTMVSVIALAISYLRLGYYQGWFIFVMLGPYWFLWRFAQKLRRNAARLRKAELTKFLCIVILQGGVSAMVPMMFFSFESLSCLLSLGFQNSRCDNTSLSAVWLSTYLAMATCISCSRKVGRAVKTLTYSNLAVMKLNRREKVQGTLTLLTALISMYLFSNLGVEAARSNFVPLAGGVGGFTMGAASIIEVITLTKGTGKGVGDTNRVSVPNRVSVTSLGDEMTVANFV